MGFSKQLSLPRLRNANEFHLSLLPLPQPLGSAVVSQVQCLILSDQIVWDTLIDASALKEWRYQPNTYPMFTG